MRGSAHNLRRKRADLEFMSTAITLMKLVGREMPSLFQNFRVSGVMNEASMPGYIAWVETERRRCENACTTSRRHLKRCKTEYDKAEDLRAKDFSITGAKERPDRVDVCRAACLI